jgi:predicted CopG family antitoxin
MKTVAVDDDVHRKMAIMKAKKNYKNFSDLIKKEVFKK